MPTESKAVVAKRAMSQGISKASWSVPEWCFRRGYSEGFYRKMRELGLGPRETRVLGRVTISEESDAEWVEKMRQRQEAEEAAAEEESA
jgi:hypothetical protein